MKSSSYPPHLRREAPERTGPRRSPLVTWRDTPAVGAPPTPAAAAPKAAPQAAPTSQAENSPVDRAVASAYRLCDDYVARGRSAAAKHTVESPLDPATVGNTMLQSWQEIGRLWVGLLEPLVANVLPRGATADTAPTKPSPAPDKTVGGSPAMQEAPAMDLVVDMASQVPTRVSVEIFRPIDPSLLETTELHALNNPRHPSIAAVRLSAEDGRLHVHLTVPPNQPAGSYVGTVFERQRQRPMGVLTVVVSGEDS